MPIVLRDSAGYLDQMFRGQRGSKQEPFVQINAV